MRYNLRIVEPVERHYASKDFDDDKSAVIGYTKEVRDFLLRQYYRVKCVVSCGMREVATIDECRLSREVASRNFLDRGTA